MTMKINITIELVMFLIFFVAPISTFIHELGHMIGAKIVHAQKIEMYIGRGKNILKISFKNLSFYIHLLFFLGGYTTYMQQYPYARRDRLIVTCLGPLNNLIFGLIFLIVYLQLTNEYLFLLFLYNLWLTIVNLIPFKIKGKYSDGLMIYRLLVNVL